MDLVVLWILWDVYLVERIERQDRSLCRERKFQNIIRGEIQRWVLTQILTNTLNCNIQHSKFNFIIDTLKMNLLFRRKSVRAETRILDLRRFRRFLVDAIEIKMSRGSKTFTFMFYLNFFRWLWCCVCVVSVRRRDRESSATRRDFFLPKSRTVVMISTFFFVNVCSWYQGIALIDFL